MRASQLRLIVLLSAVAIVAVPPAQAARKKGGVKRGTPQAMPQAAPNPQDSANLGLNGGVAGPTDEVSKDAAAMDVAEKKVEETFESSADWKSAQDDYDTAQSKYNDARKAAIAKLKGTDDYTAACAERDKTAAALQAMHKDAGVNSDDAAAAASASFTARAKVTAMEDDACRVDPAAAAAQTALAQCSARLAKLRDQEHAAVLADASYQAAKQKFDTAKSARAGVR